MRNLPVPVLEEDIDEMFNFADQDRDGKISWRYAPFPFSSKNVCVICICAIYMLDLYIQDGLTQ